MTQPVKTGTATPWREIPFPDSPPEALLYICDGHDSADPALLAEALRADGVVRSIYWAIKAVDEGTTLVRTYYGNMDGFGEALCDPRGFCPDGDQVDEARPCILAQVDVSEE